ncbi:Tetratricopeptide TPR_2 repeat protein [Burkholderia sp. H160]|nr:Tetratricopeptide TPR_2 repeat protein [Burkholderia sp. H160]
MTKGFAVRCLQSTYTRAHMTTEADLQQAVNHHQAQRFTEAEQLYRSILLADPAHPDANHNLGILALQSQQPAASLPYLKAAVTAAPHSPQYWHVYAEALTMADQPGEANRIRAEARKHGIELKGGAETPDGNLPAADELANLANEFVATIETLQHKGMHDSAEALAHQMIAALPAHGYGWKTLAYANLRRGNLQGALAPLERAAALLPLDADVRRHLDAASAMRDALVLDGRGDYEQAGKLYQRVLAVYPEHPDANHRYGVILIRLLKPEASLPYHERAIGADPNQLQYWANYIDGLLQADQLKAAWIALEMAQQRGLAGPAIDKLIGIMTVVSTQPVAKVAPAEPAPPQPQPSEPQPAVPQPAVPKAVPASAAATRPRRTSTAAPTEREIKALGELFNTGRVEEAATSARKMAERYPDHGFGWKVLAVALHRLTQYDEALKYARIAHDLWPNDEDTLQVLASVLASKGLHAEAEAKCRRLIELSPKRAEGHRVLSIILQETGRLDEAEQFARSSMELDPTSSFTPNSLGVTLMQQGRLADAIDEFRRALAIDPNFELAYNNLLFCMTHNEAIAPDELFAEHRRFAEHFEAPLKPNWPRHENARDPERALRVGFISGDFCRHAVASFLEPVAAHLSRDPKLSLYAYSNTYLDDSTTASLRKIFGHWRHVVGMSDETVAGMVRADGIDILIDLAGHTAHNRLGTLARKPAPIQACWIGYPGTTGLDAVDYFIADRLWVPSDRFRNQFSEKIAYLPAVAPFVADPICPPVNALPALHKGYVTFGSFNRMDKLRRDVVALWSRLMHAVPNSRMVIGAMPRDGSLGKLPDWFEEEGIARDRLDFMPRASVPVYLQQHHRVDFCLDSFPFSGLTTALHSLWMGVPTLTLPGETVPGRSGLTAMTHVGLANFVARDKDDFVRKGVALASDLPALAALRAGLRERCGQSPVFRPELVAETVAQALRIMWRRWCDGLPAESFDVSESANPSAPQPASTTPVVAPVDLRLVRG